MEWDVALPWYRPTRVNHLIPGAEFGWRSGWSKWPAYYVDSASPPRSTLAAARPPASCFTNTSGWARNTKARCSCATGRRDASWRSPCSHPPARYTASSEIFLEGKPLNCSDIDVGPDGWLYFSVGGRATAGSIFRIVAKVESKVPALPASGIARAIKQPQLTSAWARKAIRDVKKQTGDSWGPGLLAVATNAATSSRERVRALDLMQLFSPAPAVDMLTSLLGDKDAAVRAKAAYLLGVHSTPRSDTLLVEAARRCRRHGAPPCL